jgi:hypothetical protein
VGKGVLCERRGEVGGELVRRGEGDGMGGVLGVVSVVGE